MPIFEKIARRLKEEGGFIMASAMIFKVNICVYKSTPMPNCWLSPAIFVLRVYQSDVAKARFQDAVIRATTHACIKLTRVETHFIVYTANWKFQV